MALTDNLIFYYKFDEAAGTNVDNATGGTDGTFNLAPTWEAGKLNNCATCGGTQRVDSGINAAEAADFSLSCWFKTATASNLAFLGTGNAADNKGWWLKMGSVGAGKLSLTAGSGAGWSINDVAFSTAAYNDGNWYHFVITHNNATGDWKSYFNGTLDKTLNGAISDDGRNLFIYDRSGGTKWIGSFDEMAYWEGTVLSQANVTTLYNGGSPLAYPFVTTTYMQINIGDSWKDISALQINVGDSWKDVANISINIGDAWKVVF